MGCVPLKEVWEERATQRILQSLERRPYVQGDVLHKRPLLLEGLLQVCVGGLRVLDLHLDHDGHRRLPSIHFLLQPPSLQHLCTHEAA